MKSDAKLTISKLFFTQSIGSLHAVPSTLRIVLSTSEGTRVDT